jgi:hypothetical protein
MHNEKFHNLCSSLIIVNAIRKIRIGWTGHAARMEFKNPHYIFLQNLKTRRKLRDVGADGRGLGGGGVIIIKLMLEV